VASASTKAWLRRLGACLALMWWAAVACAHPMPESLLWIDTTADGITLTAQLPLNRLEFSFGKTLTDHPETVLGRYGDSLAAYLLLHVGARSDDKGWQVLRPKLEIVGMRGSEELQASFILRAPTGADPRTPELLYDVITHEVRTHRVQVFLRNDWKSGFVGEPPLLLGELNHEDNALHISLGQESAGGGFASLFDNGLSHIAEGTDHLLFLLLLLLVAPLVARGQRWSAMRTLPETIKHTTFVITAFTVGHTITLVLGSTGLVKAPAAPVEVGVALTIAVAAVHAWRPLFVRAETWMALGFGLIHGMAFSSSLSGAGLTRWQHAQSLLAFNLGIETMQLLALAVVLPPLLLLGSMRPAWYALIRRGLSAVAGCMACAWVLQRTELIDLGEPVWLGDGGIVPLLLVAMLWLAALGCAAVARARKRA
jgi:hypothetical protein